MIKKLLYIWVMLILLSANVHNAIAENFIINDIKVVGLKRVDIGAVFNAISVNVGSQYSDEISAKIIEQLFNTGFFEDISLSKSENNLIINVKERPVIGRLTFLGNKDISSKDLKDALEGVGIVEGYTFERSVLLKVENELAQQYFSRGKYGVKIHSEVENIDEDRVSVNIKIEEGNVTKIKKINIVGNHVFSDETLLEQIRLTSPTFWSWATKNDQYSKEKLQADLESIRSYYLDRGFANFAISSTQVSISNDKKDISITINIEEGESYKFGSFAITGESIVPKEELLEFIEFKEGELFSREKVTNSIVSISQKLGSLGYAFTNINPVHAIDENNKLINLEFNIDPGYRIYVRRIEFKGNDITDAEVLRQEMRQMESTWISTEKVQASRNRLMLLGFFEDVNIETIPVAGTDDQIDLDVKVKEQSSGQISGSIGYSQVDGLLFTLGVSQTNFLGTGKLVDFDFQRASAYKTYRVGYNNPYYTIDGVSRGFDLYYQKFDLKKMNVSHFTRDRVGGTLSYGIPISEHDRLTAGINLDDTTIKLPAQAQPKDKNVKEKISKELSEFVQKYGRDFNTGKLSLSWSHTGLDRAIFPRSGLSQSLHLQTTVPGSDLNYYELTSATSWYKPLNDSEDYILSLRNRISFGDTYKKKDIFPIFENFYGGGISSVRGFSGNTLGPKDSLKDPIGGNFAFSVTSEIFFPMPFMESKSLRTSFFIDAGNVYNTKGDANNSSIIRASTGLTVQWMSPIGTFVFSFAKPINKGSHDDLEPFQFTVGTFF